jgi:hypothetical protein
VKRISVESADLENGYLGGKKRMQPTRCRRQWPEIFHRFITIVYADLRRRRPCLPAVLLAVAVPSVSAQTVAFSAYLGGSGFEHMRDVATDPYGNIYVTGGTISPDFPVTAGALQTEHNPGTPSEPSTAIFDVFVTKYGPDGTMLWSTFLGGPNYDRAYAIEVDSQGYVYVAGRAGAGFPVTAGAFQTAFQGSPSVASYGPQDGFVAKLEPDGSGLVWASYFGTSDASIIRDIAVGPAGEVYLASAYSAGSFPPTVGSAFINTPKGAQDAVLARISADGASVVWGAYLGGPGWDSNENSVKAGHAGELYYLYTTQSFGIATAGAYDSTYGGSSDFFLCRVNQSTGAVIWGTYLGGSDNESTETHELAMDSNGFPYVSGPSKSTNYPVTAGAFQPAFGGPAGANDIVVSKLSTDGTQLLASTYIGGNGFDRSEGIAVDEQGQVFLTGTTTSGNFPVTPDAYQQSLADARDAFAVVVAPDFKTLRFSTYVSSAGADFGRCAAVDGSGNFILGGEASGAGWPLVNSSQAFAGGNGDAMIAKFVFETTAVPALGWGKEPFRLFPNPGKDEATLDLRQTRQGVHIRIIDYLGQTKSAQYYPEIRELKLDTHRLAAGVYFIEIRTEANERACLTWIRS